MVAGVPVVSGLSAGEAAERLRVHGPNRITIDPHRTLWRQLRAIVTEPMLFLVVTAGVTYFLLAEPLDGTLLLSTSVMIIALTLHQERRTAGALGALRDMSEPLATVVRDGRRLRIAAVEMVPGDVMVIAEGDRVPADGDIIECAHMETDESALTGESLPVRKTQPSHRACGGEQVQDDRSSRVHSGTLVTRGHGIAVVTATGDSTAIGRIGQSLRGMEPQHTPLQREVGTLVRFIAVVGATVAVAVAVSWTFARGGVLQGILAGTATAMALLPVEFLVVMAVFLALGARRMSRERVLARRPGAIETLGSVTVLCVDKTGTLTMNEMAVSHLWTAGDWVAVTSGCLAGELHGLVEFGLLASAVNPSDPVDRAFHSLAMRGLGGTEHIHDDWTLVREYPLSGDLMAMSHVWRSHDRSHFVIAAKGAPEAITSLCHLNGAGTAAVSGAVAGMTGTGHRVLGLACARFGADDRLPALAHDFGFTFLGLAALVDPVRAGVPEAVRQCAEAGVRTLMITGDHGGTATAVAGAVHLERSSTVLTGTEMADMSDPELASAVRSVNVYARMTPEQKLRLVTALQSDGETVAMTGDGVNDAPALTRADVGIAMGKRGTDVARDAAALVITDDDFGSIVRGIERGRVILDNIRKAMCYVMAVHTPIAGMAVIPLFVRSWPVVLMPVQIAFLQLIIDPTSALVFEAEDADPGLMERPPRRLGTPLFDRQVLVLTFLQGLIVLVFVAGVYAVGVTAGDSPATVRSTTFATLVFSNLALMLVNRSWVQPVWRASARRRNPAVTRVIAACVLVLAFLLGVPVLRRAFGFGPIDASRVLLALVAAVVSVCWFEVWKLVRDGK